MVDRLLCGVHTTLLLFFCSLLLCFIIIKCTLVSPSLFFAYIPLRRDLWISLTIQLSCRIKTRELSTCVCVCVLYVSPLCVHIYTLWLSVKSSALYLTPHYPQCIVLSLLFSQELLRERQSFSSSLSLWLSQQWFSRASLLWLKPLHFYNISRGFFSDPAQCMTDTRASLDLTVAHQTSGSYIILFFAHI